MAGISPNPIISILDNDGTPLTGGLLYTYASGTDRQVATYSDVAGTTLLPNPVQLDATGSAVIYLKVGVSYRFRITTADGTPVRTVDGIIGIVTPLTADNTPTSVIQGFVDAAAAYESACAEYAKIAQFAAVSATASAASASLSSDNSFASAISSYNSAISANDNAVLAYGYTVNGLGSQNQGVQAWDLGYITDANPLFITDLGFITNPIVVNGNPIPLPNANEVANYQSLQLRRGLASDAAATVGRAGELFYLTDKKSLQLNDGVTAGGVWVVTVPAGTDYTFGTLGVQNADAVTITGGTLDGVRITNLTEPLAVASGGTGGTTIEQLGTALQLGTAAKASIGTGSGNVIALDADRKLPPVDGSKLLNLPNTGGGGGGGKGSVRQTVLSGASFIDAAGTGRSEYFRFQTGAGSIQASLPITEATNNRTPYVVTAAGGYEGDRTARITSALSWRWDTGQSVDGRYYLYIDIAADNSVTLGYTKYLPQYRPIYEQFSTPFIAGKSYFDYTSMRMWEGQLSGTPQTVQLKQVWRVFVGEVSIVGNRESANIPYAYRGWAISAQLPFRSTSAEVAHSHAIGAPCKVTGYNVNGNTVGTIPLQWWDNTSSGGGWQYVGASGQYPAGSGNYPLPPPITVTVVALRLTGNTGDVALSSKKSDTVGLQLVRDNSGAGTPYLSAYASISPRPATPFALSGIWDVYFIAERLF